MVDRTHETIGLEVSRSFFVLDLCAGTGLCGLAGIENRVDKSVRVMVEAKYNSNTVLEQCFYWTGACCRERICYHEWQVERDVCSFEEKNWNHVVCVVVLTSSNLWCCVECFSNDDS